MARKLTLKQRRFVKAYVETGNGTEAAMRAYDTEDRHTAHAIASENLKKESIRRVVRALLDAEGLSNRKLAVILAHFLAHYESPDPREKAIALKALDMTYKLKGMYRGRTDPDDDGWRGVGVYSRQEWKHYEETGEWPKRVQHPLSGLSIEQEQLPALRPKPQEQRRLPGSSKHRDQSDDWRDPARIAELCAEAGMPGADP